GVGGVEVDGAAAGKVDRAAIEIGIEVGAAAGAGPDVDYPLVDQIAGEEVTGAGVDRVGCARGDGHAAQRGAGDAVDHGAAGGGEVAAVDGCAVKGEVQGAVRRDRVPRARDGRGEDL